MRVNYLWLSIVVFGAAERASASSCEGPPWAYEYNGPLGSDQRSVAVDAHPWRVEYCDDGQPAELEDCSLVDDATEDAIAVEPRAIGTEICGVPYHELPDYTSQQFVRSFAPAQPLTAGHVYRLECDGDPQGTVHVRDDAAPAAAAAAPELVDVYYRRGDPGRCDGRGDTIEFRVGDPMAAYLRDGGYIEARYPDGRTYGFNPWWITSDGLSWVAGDLLLLPATRETIALTPVSATGVRGETVEIDGAEIDGDLVYIPCTIAARTSPAALWLLAPFLWIAGHGRRRRRAV